MRFRFFFVLVVMICCLALAGAAVGGMWRPMGPFGDVVSDLAIAPEDANVMFACCHGGIFKSVNGGASWERVGRGSFDSVSVARTGQDLVIVSSWTADTQLSLDGGISWQTVRYDPSVPGVWTHSVAIDPRYPEVIWACTNKGVCCSNTSGASWRWRNEGLPENFEGRFVRFELSDPSGVGLYLCGLKSIYRRKSFGEDWEPVVSLESLSVQIRDLALDPEDSETLYVATDEFGVLKSVDGGGNWMPKNAGLLDLHVDRLVVCRSEPNVLYCASNAHVYVSEDGAESWQRSDEGLDVGYSVSSLVASPASADVAYVGASFGVYKTVDRGLSWCSANLGISSATVWDMAFDPVRLGRIYVSAGDVGFFRTTDNGESWDLMSMDGNPMKTAGARVVVIDPQVPLTVYAGMNNGKLLKSADGGDTWVQIYQANLTITALIIDPSNPRTMYMAVGQAVFKSHDGGESWEPAMSGLILGTSMELVMAMDPKNSSVLWLGATGFQSGRVYRSQDGAESWQQVTDWRASDIAISPVEDTVYLGGHDGLLIARSDGNGGYTFQHEQPGLLDNWVNSVSMAPGNPDVVFVGTGALGLTSLFAGVYKTTDGGESWARVPCEEMVGKRCEYVQADPFTPNQVWVGFQANALLRYTDEPGPAIELSLSTDQSQYVAGDTHIARISATNTGGDIDVDLYIAIMLPDGSLWFWPDFSSEMSPGFSMTPMPRSFSVSDVVFFNMTLPDGLPSGNYTWFGMFYTQGTQNAVSNLASAGWTFR